MMIDDRSNNLFLKFLQKCFWEQFVDLLGFVTKISQFGHIFARYLAKNLKKPPKYIKFYEKSDFLLAFVAVLWQIATI